MKKSFSPEIPEVNSEQVFLRQKIRLVGPDGKPMDVPADGAIGLLALGDVGTIAWRQKRLAIKSKLAERTQSNFAANQITGAHTS